MSYNRVGAGAGGSSYVSGMPGCELHSSGIRFLNPKMLGGNETIELPSGKPCIGNKGNGHVRIICLTSSTFIADIFNSALKFIIASMYSFLII